VDKAGLKDRACQVHKQEDFQEKGYASTPPLWTGRTTKLVS
jgi:hypothetical protein